MWVVSAAIIEGIKMINVKTTSFASKVFDMYCTLHALSRLSALKDAAGYLGYTFSKDRDSEYATANGANDVFEEAMVRVNNYCCRGCIGEDKKITAGKGWYKYSFGLILDVLSDDGIFLVKDVAGVESVDILSLKISKKASNKATLDVFSQSLVSMQEVLSGYGLCFGKGNSVELSDDVFYEVARSSFLSEFHSTNPDASELSGKMEFERDMEKYNCREYNKGIILAMSSLGYDIVSSGDASVVLSGVEIADGISVKVKEICDSKRAEMILSRVNSMASEYGCTIDEAAARPFLPELFYERMALGFSVATLGLNLSGDELNWNIEIYRETGSDCHDLIMYVRSLSLLGYEIKAGDKTIDLLIQEENRQDLLHPEDSEKKAIMAYRSNGFGVKMERLVDLAKAQIGNY